MQPLGTYDPNLEMYTDPPREPDLARLAFLRWLVETGRLESPITEGE